MFRFIGPRCRVGLRRFARAIGSGGETAMTYIKESYHSNMTLKEAEKLIL